MVYKQALIIVAIIFIIVGAILFLAPIPQPPYVAAVVLAIGLVLLVAWAIFYAASEYKSR